MPDYRLYFLQAGHVRAVEAFEAQTDEAAVARAEALRQGRPAELWNRARRVRSFPVREDA